MVRGSCLERFCQPALGHMKVHCVLLEKAMLRCWLADREGNTMSKKAPQTQINK